MAYTLAGANCIDIAADPAVIAAAREALRVAESLGIEAKQRGFGFKGLPLLMVSLNDGEDPHFRKAEFNSTECPSNCWRPCEGICPAEAIAFNRPQDGLSGVIDQRCYGCGRCLPVCPSHLIFTRSYVSTPDAVTPLLLQSGVDAIEIHTQIGRIADFQRLWQALVPWIDQLQLIAISCPDGEGLIDYLRSLYELIVPLPCPLIWQTDGRPMSGDIGVGTTHAAVKLGQKVLSAGLPGYVQLAGGTNGYTVAKLKAVGLLNWEQGNKTWENPIAYSHPYIAGIAYGSYARVLLSPVLEQLENTDMDQSRDTLAFHQLPQTIRLEEMPELLWKAVAIAHSLVTQLKSSVLSSTLSA